ncbi:DNA methyltransferase [Colwellia sp. 20A7]|uniref:DNA methyltransferase n=1 Tax=Colwellia sp. 20A7 TaxID=2689569 RepID=UPI00135741E2|nr:DNA methyltransferase [Colwellia sp. 20A7]
MTKIIEQDFPFESIDPIAESESYRKEINRPIYHIHKWWAKRLGSVFRSIVSGSLAENEWPDFHEKQNFKGSVVLDPFMGSGTTLGEAAKLGAKAIGCDVNPVSTFLVRQALTAVDKRLLEAEFDAIEVDVREKIQNFYTTRVPGGKNPTKALYYFWVKVVTTPDGEDVPLFSSYVFSKNAYASKKPQAQLLCPSCGEIFQDLYNAIKVKCPNCHHDYNPQEGPVNRSTVTDSLGNSFKVKELATSVNTPPKHHLYAIMALNEAGNKVYIKPTEFDHELLKEASDLLEELGNELPLPTMDVRPGHNTNQARGYNYKYWRDFFNDRQLLTLGLLLQRILQIKDTTIRDHFVCLFSGTLEFNNLFCSFKGEGTGAVRHMFSNHILKPERTPLENSVWGVNGKSSGTFSSLFKSRLLKAKAYLEEPFDIVIENINEGKKSTKRVCSDPIDHQLCDKYDEFTKHDRATLVLNGDSSQLPIPDCSVHAIVTDPPYFDFVHYSELSDFFYAWLSNALGDEYTYLSRPDSSHENEVQDANNESFARKICSVFEECHRVLVDEGLLSFSYHHSTIPGWMAIYNAITRSNFDIVAAHPVKAEMSVASPKSKSKNPINIDAILVCKKEQKPPRIDNAKDEIVKRFNSYIERFEAIKRNLSDGDKFVIVCSQAISIASCLKMSESDAETLVTWSVNTLVCKLHT